MSKNLLDTNLIIRFLIAVAKLGNIPLFSYDDKLKSINQVTVKEP